MAHAYLSDLNPEQRLAVEHGVVAGKTVPPLLVIAGAGSGKTKTLAHRVAHLLINGAGADRILLLTFSRRAAEEMRRRVAGIVGHALGAESVDLTWAGTFHAIGARLLREYASQIGLKPSFTILDRSDAADLMNLVRQELGLSKKESRFPTKDTCLSIYSMAVNSERSLENVVRKNFPWCDTWRAELRQLFKAYTKAKTKQNVLDYDDLLLYWAKMMEEGQFADEIGDRFDHVLVDEYQDTNQLQARILLQLKPTGNGLMVVGDDAQSIYSFRAATVRNILDFPHQFDPPARIVTLEQNYRSTQKILTACNAVIGFANERFTKNLRSDRKAGQRPALTTVLDETAQAKCVASSILEARERGIGLKSQAVLVRAAHHSAQLEIELARRNIPFKKFGGLKFLEAAHVKDLLAVLRWAENPTDRVAGFRVLQLLPGIGPSTAATVLDRIDGRDNVRDGLRAGEPPKAAADDWPSLVSLYEQLGKKKNWPGEFDTVRRWYEPYLEQAYDDARFRVDDVAQLEQIAAGYESRRKFLTEVTLDPPNATSGKAGNPSFDEDYVTISTIHSAKGLEWRSVKILSVVDGCIPSDLATGTEAEIEEERRLLYVAMTRAKDELDLVIPHRFFIRRKAKFYDGHVYASISRFIPEEIRSSFEYRTAFKSDAAATSVNAKARTKIDLSEAMDRMW